MAPEVGNFQVTRLLQTHRWLLVAPSMLLWWIIGQFDKTNISLVITDRSFLKELALVGRNAELGGLMSAFFIGYGVSIFVWGFLVDRFGPRVCLIGGTLAWATVMFMMSRAANLEELLVARFLLGLAEGNMWPVSNALTNRWFPTREHSRAQSFWLAGSTIGTAVGVPVVSALMLATNWRGMMVGLAFFSLIPILVFSFIANRPRDQKRIRPAEVHEVEKDQRTAAGAAQMSFRELLKSGPFWLIAACMVISMTTIYTLIQWIPSFLISQRGLAFKTMSGWITVGYVVATLLTLGTGYVGDRTMQRALTASVTCLIFTFLVLPGALLLPPEASAIWLSGLLFVPAAIAALNGALLHTMVQPEAIARGTGIYTGIAAIVSAIGPVAFGASISVLDGQYWGGFLFLGLLNLVGAVCYFVLHRIAPSQKKAARVAVPGSAGISLAEE